MTPTAARELGARVTELQRRRSARARLLDFARYTSPQYRAEPVHELIASRLDAVVAGPTKRIMIMAPPQVGKSQLASVHLPAYWLGRRPDDPVILTSYAASLAYSKSRQGRSLVESSEFDRLFPGVATDSDSRAVDHWGLDGRRGALLAAGVGGPIMGHGAALGIIDDPVENWEQAQSENCRQKTWEWWQSTFRTRIWEGGAIVLIQTRWHLDDLAGRLLREQPGRWDVLRLPAIAETQSERDENNRSLGLPPGEPDPLGRAPAEPLCPGRFSREEMEDVRREVGSMVWAALYQGVPRPAEGNRFKRAWFEVVDSLPEGCSFVRYWDKAGTEGAGDYTAGVLLARAPEAIWYVVDVARGRWSPFRREEIIRQTAAADQARYGHVQIWHEQEPGSSGKESAEATTRNLAGYVVHSETSTGSKAVRAEPFAAQCEAGNVKLLRGVWNEAYLEEVTSFPAGHDDQVDASSAAFGKLATVPRKPYGGFPGGGRKRRPPIFPRVPYRSVWSSN